MRWPPACRHFHYRDACCKPRHSPHEAALVPLVPDPRLGSGRRGWHRAYAGYSKTAGLVSSRAPARAPLGGGGGWEEGRSGAGAVRFWGCGGGILLGKEIKRNIKRSPHVYVWRGARGLNSAPAAKGDEKADWRQPRVPGAAQQAGSWRRPAGGSEGLSFIYLPGGGRMCAISSPTTSSLPGLRPLGYCK